MGYEIGTKYTLTGPDGTVVTFNDSADPNFIGHLTDIAGLDSPELTESGGGSYVERDGGYNGNSYWNRRPIVLEGSIAMSTTAQVDAKIEKFQRARRALRADATLAWTEADGIPRRLLLRLQNFRLAKGFPKTFVLGMISASHLIESSAEQTVTDNVAPLSLVPTNLGNDEAMPVIEVTGAGTTPLTITLDGSTILRMTYAIPAGRKVAIDWKNRTARDDLGANLYRYIDFSVTTWQGLPAGAHTIACDKGTALTVRWRHSWD